MTTRGREPGCRKTGGRVVGSKNKLAVTDRMRNDILSVYAGLGGVSFLLEWAQKNPTEFIKHCWSRIAPPMPREEPELASQTNINVNNLDSFEAARRIAFVLNKALYDQQAAQPPIKTIEAGPLPQLDTVSVMESFPSTSRKKLAP